jgi:hypothetical protein
MKELGEQARRDVSNGLDVEKMRKQAEACRLYAKTAREEVRESWLRAAEEWDKLAEVVEALNARITEATKRE